MHEILKYEKNIFMEKMGKQYSQTPTRSFLFTASPHKDFEIAILQDKRHYISK